MTSNNPEKSSEDSPEVKAFFGEETQAPKPAEAPEAPQAPKAPEAPEISETPEAPQPKEERERFELADLEEAKNKKYPWAKTAESSRKFLADKITDTEDTLKQLAEGVKESTPLHKQIEKAAYLRFKDREKKGEAGSATDDFLAAAKDIETINKTKLEIFNQRWQRLEVLSSTEKGAQDEELNKRAYEKTESLTKKGKKPDAIECNDKTRAEMLEEIKEGVTDKQAKQEVEKREEERIDNLKRELVDTHREIGGIIETPVRKEEKEAKEKLAQELFRKSKEMVKVLTGEDLEQRINIEPRRELEKEGFKMITKKEYFSQKRVDKLEQRIQQRRWGMGVKEAWRLLPDSEKQKHNGDVRKFTEQLEIKRKDLEKKGITLSRDVFYEFMRMGLKPENFERKGIFWKKIVISSSPWGKQKMAEKQFKTWIEDSQRRISELNKNEANKEVNRGWVEARNRWVRRKYRKFGEIIKNITAV